MSLVQKLLSKLPPEFAHRIGKIAMRRRINAPGPFDMRPVSLAGALMRNPLGLAAGFDKNAELLTDMNHYGFGWVEVGSVTYLGGKGNPKPRLFRVGKDELVNRMGLNGDPAADIAARLEAHTVELDGRECQFAVNVAKSHHPHVIGDAGIRDVMATYSLVKTYGAYTAINVSCPNTREGKTFEEPGALNELLEALRPLAFQEDSRPVFLKLSPSLWFNKSNFEEVMGIVAEYEFVRGLILCNTLSFTDQDGIGRGGLSGHLVRELALDLMTKAANRTRGFGRRITLIGCGGIYNGYHMARYFMHGADAVQAYCGFVRGENAGPDFTHKVLKAFIAEKVKPYRGSDRKLEKWFEDSLRPHVYGSYLDRIAHKVSNKGVVVLSESEGEDEE